MERSLETGMMETKQRVDGIIYCIGCTALNRTVLFAAGRKDCFLREDAIQQGGHERVLSMDGGGEHEPPTAVNVVLFDGFVRGAPEPPLQAG